MWQIINTANDVAYKVANTGSQNVNDGHSASLFSCVHGHVQLNSKNLLLSYALLWSSINTKFHCEAKIGLCVGISWKPPQGFSTDDYVQFHHLQPEIITVISNSEKINILAEELRKNGNSDLWVKLILGCVSVMGVVGALLSQIFKLKANTKWKWGPRPTQPTMLPMYNSQLQ